MSSAACITSVPQLIVNTVYIAQKLSIFLLFTTRFYHGLKSLNTAITVFHQAFSDVGTCLISRFLVTALSSGSTVLPFMCQSQYIILTMYYNFTCCFYCDELGLALSEQNIELRSRMKRKIFRHKRH